MLKLAVILIDESYSAPEGTLHLGSNGWLVDEPELLTFRTNQALEQLLERIAESSAGLLGPGELVLAVLSQDGTPTALTGVLEYKGRVLFAPEQAT